MSNPATTSAKAWLTAAEALELLQVRAQTLYANVSRGRIRARPDAADPRRSRYHRGDVLALVRARPGRRAIASVASGAMAWGDPVMPSALSTVVDGRLLYRGQDACELGRHATLEDVAALLWDGPAPGPAAEDRPRPRAAAPAAPVEAGSDPVTRALQALAAGLGDELPTLNRSHGVLLQDAARVFHTVADALIGPPSPPSRRPASRPSTAPASKRPLPGAAVSHRLAQAWGQPRAEPLLRLALVVLADHELNASTFACRVAVSTGASLAAGVVAGLATLSGPLHGNAAAVLEQLLESARQAGVARSVRDAIAQGRRLATWGHPLYPEGDPRAAVLLAGLQLPPLHAELARHAESMLGEKPNIDFALSALSHSLKLPAHAALTLFALARTVGWLAHGLEQAQTGGGPIRPRARYTGPGVDVTGPVARRSPG